MRLARIGDQITARRLGDGDHGADVGADVVEDPRGTDRKFNHPRPDLAPSSAALRTPGKQVGGWVGRSGGGVWRSAAGRGGSAQPGACAAV